MERLAFARMSTAESTRKAPVLGCNGSFPAPRQAGFGLPLPSQRVFSFFLI